MQWRFNYPSLSNVIIILFKLGKNVLIDAFIVKPQNISKVYCCTGAEHCSSGEGLELSVLRHLCEILKETNSGLE